VSPIAPALDSPLGPTPVLRIELAFFAVVQPAPGAHWIDGARQPVVGPAEFRAKSGGSWRDWPPDGSGRHHC